MPRKEMAVGALMRQVDVVIIGAGFAGMYAVHRCREAGLSIQGYEAGTDVGGTWYWNRYPGARCDVRSFDYSYSFSEELQQEWTWTHQYADQAEILRYANHVADRFDLRSAFEFETRINATVYDEKRCGWTIETDKGENIWAQYCIMATGPLSVPRKPDFSGLDDFKGRWYHTGNWPHEKIDFSGQRVGVIGTGSSGIQIIPQLAKYASQLYVFQRTPHFTLPARNVTISSEEDSKFKERYSEYRIEAFDSFAGAVRENWVELYPLELGPEQRREEFEKLWAVGGTRVIRANKDVLVDPEVNEAVAEFIREKIKETVKDPEVAKQLTPRGYPVGTKRICLDTGYYETYNRPNVTLVDVRDSPIENIEAKGLRTQDSLYELDSLIFATGYDALTGALLDIHIQGRQGLTLKKKWDEGPRTLYGIMVSGFPNMFILNGPGSPAVLANPILGAELQSNWAVDCIIWLKASRGEAIDAKIEAETEWVDHANDVASRTLYPHAQSWYMGANIPGKPRVFMPYIGGFNQYREFLEAAQGNGYDNFDVTVRESA